MCAVSISRVGGELSNRGYAYDYLKPVQGLARVLGSVADENATFAMNRDENIHVVPSHIHVLSLSDQVVQKSHLRYIEPLVDDPQANLLHPKVQMEHDQAAKD